MKEPATEIDPRNICRNVIDDFPVWEFGPGASSEEEGTFVDSGDETCSKDDACCKGTVETMIQAQRGDYL